MKYDVLADDRGTFAKLSNRVGAFASSMRKQITAAVRALPEIELGADASDADKAIARIRGELAGLSQRRVGVDIDADEAVAQVRRLQGELAELSGSAASVQVRADAAAALAALDRVDAAVRRVDGSTARADVQLDTAQAQADAERFSDRLRTGFAAGFAAAGAAGAAALAKGFSDSLDIEAGTARLAGQFALTEQDAARAGEAAGAVFASGLVDTMGEAQTAVAAVGRHIVDLGGAPADQVAGLAEKAQVLASTFGVDVGEAARSAGQLIKTGLAANADEAFDLITRGFESGADASGDFLDTINEYAPFLQQLGIDGSAAFGSLAAAQRLGIRDADQWGDALKEFGIRAVDTAESTTDAYESLGLSADQTRQAIAAGGPAAQQAMSQVVRALMAVQDPVEQNRVGVALFGTQWEDTARRVLPALDPLAAKMADVGGATDRLNDTTETAQQRIQAMRNEATLWLASLVELPGPLGTVTTGIAAFGPAAAGALSGVLPLFAALRMGALAKEVQGSTGAIVASLSGVGAGADGMRGKLAGVGDEAERGMGSKLRGIAGFLGKAGPWGVAIGGAVLALSSLRDGHDAARDASQQQRTALEGLRGTLDQYSGAVTMATASEKARELSTRLLADGSRSYLQAARDLGVAVEDFTQAALGSDAALQRVNAQLVTHAGTIVAADAQYQRFAPTLNAAGITLEDVARAALLGGDAQEELRRRVAALDPALMVNNARLTDLVMRLGDTLGPTRELSDEVIFSAQGLAAMADQARLAAQASGGLTTELARQVDAHLATAEAAGRKAEADAVARGESNAAEIAARAHRDELIRLAGQSEGPTRDALLRAAAAMDVTSGSALTAEARARAQKDELGRLAAQADGPLREALLAASRDFDSMGGAAATAEQRARAQKEELLRLAATASGPLRTELLRLADQIRGIPDRSPVISVDTRLVGPFGADLTRHISQGGKSAATGGILPQPGSDLPVQRYADAGIMPGYTPGRDVHRFWSPTGGLLELSGGEPVMRPEFARAVGSSWIHGANRAARAGGVRGVADFVARTAPRAGEGVRGDGSALAAGGMIQVEDGTYVRPDFFSKVSPKYAAKFGVPPGATVVGGDGAGRSLGSLRVSVRARNSFAGGGIFGADRLAAARSALAPMMDRAERAAIDALQPRIIARLRTLAEGFIGPGAAGALNWARSQAGKPYLWGGVGPAGYDCSGFMSAILNVIQNRPPHTRRGATSTFPWPGFRPGLGGTFSIGSFRGSPGHMAGTLAGVNVESSGGVGVRVGGGARGASHPMFVTRAHLADRGALVRSGEAAINLSGQMERMLDPVQTRIWDALTSRRGTSTVPVAAGAASSEALLAETVRMRADLDRLGERIERAVADAVPINIESRGEDPVEIAQRTVLMLRARRR